ncbi:hypothetical protein TNCV_1943331 [Trichonephila clavipes]|nr:hypothetical protein TNCV_1943331 [Trichonephila clavipes]
MQDLKGDRDFKAFDTLKKTIYEDEYLIEKSECIEHVMERMGTGFRQLITQVKGQILSNVLGLFSEGDLVP